MSKRKKEPKLLKLSVGQDKEGYDRVERLKLQGKTWPYKDGTVEEVFADHQLEFIPKQHRIPFMEELYRVLCKEGKATFISIYWSSPLAIFDSDYEWPPISEQTFLHFNKAWREQNRKSPIKCDYDFTYGYYTDLETQGRSQDVQPFWIKHYLGSVINVQANLVKRNP